jgi:quercetin dioxygenase-like cupin family protein
MAASEVIHVGRIDVRFRLEAGQTAGNLTMFEFVVPARARVPIAHSHDSFDETVYGLSGFITWTLDGRTSRMGPADVLFIPRGHVHQFENLDAEDARALSVITRAYSTRSTSARLLRSSMLPGRRTWIESWTS